MKLKLDENLGKRCEQALRALGHDPITVAAQDMRGAADRQLITKCAQEQRCLVTFDMDFANPLVFNPAVYHGIAVLRLPARPVHGDLLIAAETLGRALADADVRGRLWIVQHRRVQVYQPDQ